MEGEARRGVLRLRPAAAEHAAPVDERRLSDAVRLLARPGDDQVEVLRGRLQVVPVGGYVVRFPTEWLLSRLLQFPCF
ncbi:hypothetical protein SCE1572_06710 [Sorangium cellulosum So0157-2]|uniref:Uncharacterized protein n=1 Tax=Sorangium cellulosum So0157-2 TaxID=1254432 RepID=S4XNT3_SORCE|nr:hypothetical protein SCE1572_06710 [Sorangium cellulosum So0157-2]